MMEAAVANGDANLSPSAASKKMKQTRLPFQVLTGSPVSPLPAKPAGTDSRKRKPSVESETVRAAKIGRISEVKENIGGGKDVSAVVEPSVVILDDESNSTDLVDVRKDHDQKLLVVKVDSPRTPKRDDGGAAGTPGGGGASAGGGKKSAEKFMIKLPVGKKKTKKDAGEGGAGSAKKGKAHKEKKKSKKGGKDKKEGSSVGAATTGESATSIVIDDSDLSDGEEEHADEGDKKSEAKATEEVAAEVKPVEEKSSAKKAKRKSVQTKEQSKKSAVEVTTKNAEHNSDEIVAVEDSPVSADEKSKVVTKPESPVSAEKKTKANGGKTSSPIANGKSKVESKTKSSPATEKKSVVDETKDTLVDKHPEVEEIIDSEPEAEKEDETVAKTDQEQKSTETKETDKEETPRRRGRPSRSVATQKGEVEREDAAKSAKKTPASRKKAAPKESPKSTGKKSAPASDQKPKAEAPSKEEAKKNSSSKGALDKFFAKVQTEKKAADSGSDSSPKEETKEAPKTPEKAATTTVDLEEDSPEPMETDDQEQPAGNNSTIASICLDDSTDGNDEENAYMLCTPNSKERTGSGGLGNIVLEKKLTPKQLARKKEAEKKQAQKLQELEDKKRKKLEEKEAKVREREEQERLKKKEKEEKEELKRKEREEKEEQKRKEREEKEEQKRKEKEEKEKKRLAELEAKNEERRKKDEQKEEERKKKEEEKEAEEKRKQKTAQAFQSFFVKKAGSKEARTSDDENSMEQVQFAEGEPGRQAFMPFCVKGDMRLAPICRVTLSGGRKKRLDEMLMKVEKGLEKSADELYIKQLKSKQYRVGKCERTWTAQEDENGDDDVIVIDDTICHRIEVDQSAVPKKIFRAKFFLFEENRRPPYRGTWRKRSGAIKARRPFAQDTKFFDYEVDSDDEWEEEEPGESLHGSDDEKDMDPEEEYEVDNDFFVPHGHLSDEEMRAEDDVLEDNSPETQKAKLKIMQQEFAAEMKKKTEKIKPRLIGCLWENNSADGEQRSECSAVIWEILKARAMLFDPEEPISFTTLQKQDPESNSSSPAKEKEVSERKPKQIKLIDEGVKELISLLHGCAQNKKFMVMEFLAYWAKRRDEGHFNAPNYAPDSIRAKIVEIASWRPCPDEGPMQNKMCWYVNKEALVKYELTDIKIPTGWEFILKPIVKSKKEKREKEKQSAEGGGTVEEEKKTPPKKESADEKEKKERLNPSSGSASKPAKATTPAVSITKFTKKLSEDDKRKQFAKARKSGHGSTSPAAPAGSATGKQQSGSASKLKSAAKTAKAATSASAANAEQQQPKAQQQQPAPQNKKRVQLLMSVPRGQQINQTTKNNLIGKFLAKGKSAASSTTQPEAAPAAEAMEVDPPVEIVVLDDD